MKEKEKWKKKMRVYSQWTWVVANAAMFNIQRAIKTGGSYHVD